jgi:hypothetical protein
MFEENSLFTPMESSRNIEVSGSQFFINFLNQLEGWKTKCKNLHWAAPKKNIHVYLDEFLDILSDYQDGLAEEYQGLLGHMQPNAIKGVESSSLNAIDFISEVKQGTLKFYSRIPEGIEFSGIKSECETFIHNILKYKYLFELCDNKPY